MPGLLGVGGSVCPPPDSIYGLELISLSPSVSAPWGLLITVPSAFWSSPALLPEGTHITPRFLKGSNNDPQKKICVLAEAILLHRHACPPARSVLGIA